MLKRVVYIEFLYIALPLIYLLLATVGTVFEFIQIAENYQTKLYPYMYIAEELTHNLLQSTLVDIKPISSDQLDCPRGYSKLAVAYWSGNRAGCYDKRNDTVFEGSCHIQDKNSNEFDYLENIPSQTKMPLYIWGNHQLCAKTVSYSTINFGSTTCPPKLKPCSKGIICISEESEYPITSVEFFEDSNGNLNLSFERDPEENAIIDISTSANSIPCLNPSHVPLANTDNVYPLEIFVATEGCDQFGVRQEFSVQIDKKPLEDLYRENGIDKMYNKLPKYPNYIMGRNMVLYYQRKVDIKPGPACGNILQNLEVIVESIKEFSLSGGYLTTLVAYNIILLVFGFVMFFYLYCDKEGEERSRYFREQKCLFHAFHFFPYIICVLYLVQNTLTPEDGGPKVANILNNTGVINSGNCFNQNQYSLVFLQLQDKMAKILENYYGPTKIMGIISYVFIILMLILRGLRGYYEKEVDAYEARYLENKFSLLQNQPETELTTTAVSVMQESVTTEEIQVEEASSPYLPFQNEAEI